MNRYHQRHLTVEMKRERDRQVNNHILKYKYREKNNKVLMRDEMPQYSRCEALKTIL